jgi:predicted RNA polymerase sigma factor
MYSAAMTAAEAHRAIDAVWRIESPRVIAGLARLVRDVGLAEELAQDALVAALERWPTQGVPDNPGAWLMATAKHRAIDRQRRSSPSASTPRSAASSTSARTSSTRSTHPSTTTSATTCCA